MKLHNLEYKQLAEHPVVVACVAPDFSKDRGATHPKTERPFPLDLSFLQILQEVSGSYFSPQGEDTKLQNPVNVTSRCPSAETVILEKKI